MSNKTISSQKYLDDSIVEGKRATKDYVVTTHDITVNGVDYTVIVDGHHSLAAAIADCVEPEFVAASQSLASSYSEGEDFLLQNQIDSDWYDIATGLAVWQ